MDFDDNRQHDAAEFLSSIINNLFGKSNALNSLKEIVFGGLFKKTMFCQCNYTQELGIENLSEVVPIELKGVTLESCLEDFSVLKKFIRLVLCVKMKLQHKSSHLLEILQY